MSEAIPENLRKQLSAAGKANAEKHDHAHFVNLGNRGWEAKKKKYSREDFVRIIKSGLATRKENYEGSERAAAVKQRQLEARRLKAEGKSYTEIAQLLGVTRQRAQQYVKTKNAGDKCVKCGSTEAPLHCHHTDYATDQSITLCRKCHSQAHSGDSNGRKGWDAKLKKYAELDKMRESNEQRDSR